MNILYIHQYFATLSGSTGTRSYEFARRWAKAGHKVTMLTTTAQLACDDLLRAGGRLIKKFSVDNIDIIAVYAPYRQQMGIGRRLIAFLYFLVISSLLILFIRKIDIVYATSTPLTVGVPALVAKWLRRKPFVFEVRDQWPEVPIELGIIKNKMLIKILLWLEKTIYKNSSAVVALSPGMADGIRSVLDEDKKILVIPNSSDTNVFKPDIDGAKVRQKYGWDDKLVFLHTGAMGLVNSLDFIIDAAVKLGDNPEILFVLLGEGSQRPVLQQRAKELDLKNVEILPAVPKQKLVEILAAADVAMVIFGNYPIIQHNSANKFFDALSAGKPILLNYSGWQREVLESNNAGQGCDLYNLEQFIGHVLYFNSHREQLVEMGQNARQIAIEMFDRDNLANQVLSVLECQCPAAKC